MDDVGKSIVDNWGSLVSVIGCSRLTEQERGPVSVFEEIEVNFTSGTATVIAESEYDTVRVEGRFSKLPSRVDLSDAEPWSQFIGSSALWTWTLTNQQGYTDGFQLEFRTSSDFLGIQLVCVASHLRVSVVVPNEH